MNRDDQSYPIFFEEDLEQSPYEEARFHIISVPLEKSVSYGGGTAEGPRAILAASSYLELVEGVGSPGSGGVHTHAPIPCEGRDTEEVLAKLTRAVGKVLELGAVPVVLGGEHTVTLGVVRAYVESGRSIGVVQFDAHADLREIYEGNALSHACVMRRIHELGVPFVQLGVRSLSLAEVKFRKANSLLHFDADPLYHQGIPKKIFPDDFPEEVFITFDVDGLDASIMPATGTPEPGGLSWYQAVDLLRKISEERKIVGCDVVELAPMAGLHHPDFTAAKLTYTMMCLAARSRN